MQQENAKFPLPERSPLAGNRQSDQNAKGLFISAMALNLRLFTEGNFDTAYHALAAALHLATVTENENDVALVAETANRQLAWINQNARDNIHSSESTALRGNQPGGQSISPTVSIWGMLAAMAHSRGVIFSSRSLLKGADTVKPK